MDLLTDILPIWVWALFVFGFVVLVLASLAMGTLRYELRDDALCLLVMGRVVRRVPYSNIENVRRGLVWFSERWKRKTADPNVTLRLREGLFIYMAINPPDSTAFLADLESRLHSDEHFQPGALHE